MSASAYMLQAYSLVRILQTNSSVYPSNAMGMLHNRPIDAHLLTTIIDSKFAAIHRLRLQDVRV